MGYLVVLEMAVKARDRPYNPVIGGNWADISNGIGEVNRKCTELWLFAEVVSLNFSERIGNLTGMHSRKHRHLGVFPLASPIADYFLEKGSCVIKANRRSED